MNEKISAFFVYHDEKGRNVYYDIITKTYYLITNKNISDFKKYNLRVMGAIIVFLVVFAIMGSGAVFFAALAGIAVYAVMYIMFRIKLLPELIPLAKFDRPKKDNIIVQTAKDLDTPRLITVIVMTILFIATIYLNISLTDNITKVALYTYYLLYVFMFVFLAVNVGALIYKLTNKDKLK